MRIKADLSELEVPESIEKRYKKWCVDNEQPEEYDKELFDDFWMDIMDECNGKLLPKNEAIFWSNWITKNPSFYGGYPFDYGMSFKEGGKIFTILVVGWTGEIEEESKNYDPFRCVYVEPDNNPINQK